MHTASDSNYVNIIYFKYFIIIIHIRNSVISIKLHTEKCYIYYMFQVTDKCNVKVYAIT